MLLVLVSECCVYQHTKHRCSIKVVKHCDNAACLLKHLTGSRWTNKELNIKTICGGKDLQYKFFSFE